VEDKVAYGPAGSTTPALEVEVEVKDDAFSAMLLLVFISSPPIA
jgi:hypothetical protein